LQFKGFETEFTGAGKLRDKGVAADAGSCQMELS